MPITLRTAIDSDWPMICHVDGRAFGSHFSEEDVKAVRTVHEISRFELALDGKEIVGVSAAYSMSVTVPGGGQLPMGGLTWVSTATTHRRQGVLATLMARTLADVDRRNEPVAMLTASEGAIYERYGFGVATQVRVTTVDRRLTQLRPEFRPKAGAVRFLEGDAAVAHATEVWPRFQRTRAGEMARDAAWHKLNFDMWAKPNGSYTPALYLAHRDGYAVYRIDENWNDGQPAHAMRLLELAAVTADAHAALWHTLLGVDLVGSIVSRIVPIDDPLPYLLTNPRALQTTALNDGVWVNVRDVARCFSARTYGTSDRLIVDVDGTRWAIDGGPDGGVCKRVRTRADVTTELASIGALLLGGVRPSTLAAGRRLTARNAETLRRADAFFVTGPAPHCQTPF
jgi:predicted acetyltransferase